MKKLLFGLSAVIVLSNVSLSLLADNGIDQNANKGAAQNVDKSAAHAADLELKRKVEAALDDAAASDDIKIEVKDNVITLEGDTLTEKSAALAEQTVRTAVKDVPGVVIKNTLNGVHD